MGWHGARKNQLFSLGSTVDPIIQRSPCNVVVLKGVRNMKYTKILVPLAGGPNSAFALEIATILADKEEGHVTAFTVQTAKQRFDIPKFLNDHEDRLHIQRSRIRTKSVDVEHITDAVLTEAADYDLVVLGCSHKSLIFKVTQESIPEHIARRCSKPLVFVNEAQGIHSLIRKLI
jgi:nucleotide-binding universal stress UspA family protein